MVAYLKNEQNITDSQELRRLLVPTFKTGKHFLSDNGVDGISSSLDGYYTAQGYCSMKISAKGNSYKIDTRLLNFKKTETYKNSFELQGIA